MKAWPYRKPHVSMQIGVLPPLLAQVQKSVGLAEAQFGPLDVVIANAGMPSSSAPLNSLSSLKLQPILSTPQSFQESSCRLLASVEAHVLFPI